ncbi:MAG: hypothetical protein ACKO2K_08760 [Alphaproteobacteria bacterium]
MSRVAEIVPRVRAAAPLRESSPAWSVIGPAAGELASPAVAGEGDVARADAGAATIVPALAAEFAPIGATVDLVLEVRLASLGRVFDDDWHFDLQLDLVREVPAVAVRLSRTRWRLREALPLTPFGIWAPVLDLDDIFEVAGTPGKSARLVRRVKRGLPWNSSFADVTEEHVRRPGVSRLLHELHDAGGSWVVPGEGLLLQFPRLPQETMASPAFTQRLSMLDTLLR